MSNRFIIGIGSQRAGSTLLHSLLSESTGAFMHPLKELHFFDTLNGVRAESALRDHCRKQMLREVDHITQSSQHDFINDRFRCYLRTCKMLATDSLGAIDYQDLYRPFLMRSPLLGEATPEYMLLQPDAVDRMKQVVGADAGVILLCRHPVERILSAVKLMNVYNNLGMDEAAARRWLGRMLADGGSWMAMQDGYNDYERATQIYASRFSSFIALSYESLISNPAASARAIQAALGVDVDVAAFSAGTRSVRNDLGINFDFGDELRGELFKRYRKQIDYYERTF